MKHRKMWVFAGIALIAVLGLGIWSGQQNTAKKQLQTTLGNHYLRAFYNTSDHVQNSQVLLGKSLVTQDPGQYGVILQELRLQASQALDNLAQLPVDDAVLGRTAKFMTQMGDYAQTLTKQVAQGVPVQQEQWDTLNRLYSQSSDLNTQLGQIHADVAQGKLDFHRLAAAAGSSLNAAGKKLVGDSFQKIDKGMRGYPTLIYDGPFSDHMEQGKARGLTGAQVNKEKARQVALKGFDSHSMKQDKVLARVTGTVDGNIPAYRVELTPPGEKNPELATVADVSQKGGHLIWYLHPRQVTSASYNLERAQDKAEAYLKQQGFKNMQLNYHQQHDHTVTFNYVYTQQGVKIYPDLIKVTVALDNGQVVAFDARGYLMSHRQRQLPRQQITQEQARELVNDKIELLGPGRLALIPLPVEQEKLTWEFKGQLGQDQYLIYINAIDGEEENLLRVIETKDGTLTM